MKDIVGLTSRFVVVRGLPLVILLGLAVASCSDDAPATARPTTTAESTSSSSTTTTAPERPTSTTTTAFDPASVEGQVEAAYLKSWDVYAEAVYDLELDEAALAEVYAEPLLTTRREELESRVEDARAALVDVDHGYRIEITGPDTALIVDTYVNHQVLIDPTTKAPIEDDPAVTIVDAFTARRVGQAWLMFDLRRLG